MEIRRLLDFLKTAEQLKCNTRHSYTSNGRLESVAEHSWRLALMAMLVGDEFPELDIDKVIKMCLIHDLGECFIGDIPCFAKTETDEENEEKQLRAWTATLPEPYCGEMAALYDEMLALETTEARIYKALDNMEAVLQHNESPISTWEPHEYELNLTYAADKAAFSPYMTALRQAIRKETEEKIKNG